MGDTRVVASTRSALRKAAAGEIVEVQGGHIVRSTGRKDRHSKVCTSKGPRDRRVRLAAHTAIQFYDVQDRLGYDRPSKAVDWLMKKAKSAIDELKELPAWHPSNVNISSGSSKGKGAFDEYGGRGGDGGGSGAVLVDEGSGDMYIGHQHRQQQMGGNAGSGSSFSLVPPSLDSDSIADTIKSFFPMGEAPSTTTSSPAPPPLPPQLQFQNYPPDLLSRTSSHSQDLRLSLQSFQDPMLLQSHHNHPHSHHSHAHAHSSEQQSLFSGAAPLGFDNWANSAHPSPEIGRLQRQLVGWSTGADSTGAGGSTGGGFMFNSPPLLQPLFGHGHTQAFTTQRGPLQSSNTPLVRTWISDPSSITASASTTDHLQAIPIHPQSLQGIGFASGGFSGFHIPARIQGEEEHGGDPNKPSSASSGSRH